MIQTLIHLELLSSGNCVSSFGDKNYKNNLELDR